LSSVQVILDLLHRAGVLKNEAVKIVFVDTFHLFPETYAFLAEVEVGIALL
jgi:phosphoadenosine phosphosulfate reductase